MAASWDTDRSSLERYDAPKWLENVFKVPKYRIKLAHLPTPVHRWNPPGVPQDFTLYIKRDDLTGCALSGNKIRKLEFILAEAKAQGCSHVIASGTESSNHCRTTAVAAAQVGLKCHLIQASNTERIEDSCCLGNSYISKLAGADVHFVPMHWIWRNESWPQQQELAKRIEEETGEKSYIVPVGGSDTVGLFGYVEAYRELIEQGLLDHVTDIALCGGTGGTLAGLALANHLAANSKIGLHAIAIGYPVETIHQHCNMEFSKLGINLRSEDLVNCVGDYLGPGYSKVTQEDLDFIKGVGKSTGILLDPVYTGKTARGLIQEMKLNPHKFKGKNVLFLHTGGLFCGMDHDALTTSLKVNPSGHQNIWKDH